jgi:peptidoglycan hydrolase-like protein with peptidoglycan-binding domain
VRPGGSDRVRDVQRRLMQLGYRPGPVDGLFGPRTRAAVRWFQYKHGLPTRGRVNRSTLTVLHARSDHEPLRTVRRERERQGDDVRPAAPQPAPAPLPEDGRDYTGIIILALLLALGLGVIAGLFGPELRNAFRTAPTPPEPTAVLGYATDDADTEAIARRAASSGWSLAEVVHDQRQPGRRLAERRGLVYALRELRKGSASGLVVARLNDVAPRIADLATLVHWLDEANAFLAAADHDLDTSTEEGRATARAIVELGAWERRNITQREREDLASGRFTPRAEPSPAELAEQLAGMLERGIPPRAVTDALVLAGLAGRSESPTEERRRM